MVKNANDDNNSNKGGAIDLGTVVTPLALYGLRKAMDSTGSRKMMSNPFGKRVGGDNKDKQNDLKYLLDMINDDDDKTNVQDGGKKKAKKGGDKDDDKKDDQDGGKKKAKKGGDKDDDKKDDQDGGKKKTKKGGDKDDDKKDDQDGGKKRRMKKRGGADMAGLDFASIASKIAGLPEGGAYEMTQAVVAAPAPAPAAVMMAPAPPTPPQVGGKRRQQKKKGGALDLYAEQLREISSRLDDLMRN